MSHEQIPKRCARLAPAFFLFWMILFVSGTSPLLAQNATKSDTPCQGSDPLIASQGFTVKEIRIRPLLKFMPGQSLNEALKAAIAEQSLGDDGVRVGEPFDSVGVTILEASLGQELFARQLSEQSGLIYPRHRLFNCDAGTHTLVVEYQVFVIARPSYKNTNFELAARADKEKQQSGEAK